MSSTNDKESTPPSVNESTATTSSPTDQNNPKKVSFNEEIVVESKNNSDPNNLIKSPPILKKPIEKSPPPRPPRPMSAVEKAKNSLKEAFPTVDDKYITAVLIASEGDLNPAFNALLYISDPESKIEIPEPKAKPPVPPKKQSLQEKEDERLARKLAKEFNKPIGRNNNNSTIRRVNEEPDLLNQFIDEDLPQLKKQFEKGFEETSKKVGTFFNGFAKQFQQNDSDDDEFDEDYGRYRNKQTKARNYRKYDDRDRTTRMNTARNSQKNLNDDGQLFGALGSLGSPPTSARNSAQFKRSDDEDDSKPYEAIKLTNNDKDLPIVPVASNKSEKEEVKESTKKESKWQPLTDVPPQPITDDAFLVTSSDDEDDDEESGLPTETKK